MGDQAVPARRRGWLKRAAFGFLATCAAALLATVLAFGFFSSDALRLSSTPRPLTYEVQRGDLSFTTHESGSIRPATWEEIKCKAPRGGIIKWVIEDGAHVKAGDLLMKLDSGYFELKIMGYRMNVERSRAAKIAAQQTLNAAEIAVREYEEGAFVSQLALAESTIVVAEEALRSAQNAFGHAEEIHRKGYISPLELQDAKFAVTKAELDLETAKKARDVLVEFTKPKTLATLIGARDAAKGHLLAARGTYEVELQDLDKAEAELKEFEVRAPADGMVVLNNDDADSWEGLPIQEGAMVRENQLLMILPDMSRLRARARVHESRLADIKLGDRARVTVGDRVFQGAVDEIARQPRPRKSPFDPEHEYEVYVMLDGTAENLRYGVTAEVEFLTGRETGSLTVPAQSLIRTPEGFACWVETPEGFERRLVETGRSNATMMEVLSGVSEGDKVLFDPQPLVSSMSDSQTAFFSRELAERVLASINPERPRFEPASRRDLDVTIRGEATLRSQRDATVVCRLFGDPVIAWVVEEGAMVKAGDEVVKYDATLFQETVDLYSVEAVRARAVRDQAAFAYESATVAVDAYLDGEYLQTHKTCEAAVRVAERNLEAARQTLASTRGLARKGFVTPLQLEAQQFAVRRTELELKVAVTALHTLENFTKEKTLGDLVAARDIALATYEGEKLAYDLQVALRDRYQMWVDNCTSVAPCDGMVVYVNSVSRRIEPGTEVYESRRIINLPDLSRMTAELFVHESKIDQVAVGMPAVVEVRGRKYEARVSNVDKQPSQRENSSFFSPYFREYVVDVEISESVEGMKPGMTAEVTIGLASRDSALTVPVAAVAEQDGRFYCWVDSPTGPARREVKLGVSDNSRVEILDGLADGETVVANAVASIGQTRMIPIRQDTPELMLARFGANAAAVANDVRDEPAHMPGG